MTHHILKIKNYTSKLPIPVNRVGQIVDVRHLNWSFIKICSPECILHLSTYRQTDKQINVVKIENIHINRYNLDNLFN